MFIDSLVPFSESVELRKLNETMSRIISENKSFAIWGAAYTGNSTAEFISQKWNVLPKMFIDNNPSLWGKPSTISDRVYVYEPKKFMESENITDEVLICVYVADIVEKQLKEMGYKGRVTLINCTLFESPESIYNEIYSQHEDELEKLYSIAADSISRETLTCFMNCVRTGDSEYLKKINSDSTQKLMESSIFNFTDNESLVDIGAFTGDTIRCFLKATGKKYNKITAIEANAQNFSILENYIKTEGLENVNLMCCAAGAENKEMTFSGCSESFHLSESGSETVQMIKLDDTEAVQDMTLMKICALRFELTVIEGAKEIIKKRKPKISSYAARSLFWEIPFYLKELVPEYKIYLRHYGMGRQAMICYAVCGD